MVTLAGYAIFGYLELHCNQNHKVNLVTYQCPSLDFLVIVVQQVQTASTKKKIPKMSTTWKTMELTLLMNWLKANGVLVGHPQPIWHWMSPTQLQVCNTFP